MVKYLAAQRVVVDRRETPIFAGAFAIFGHGNVVALGEALQLHRDVFPTFRSHNEQAMAHSAIAYAKAHRRKRMMMCTTSIGPGATNMVTACALASVNRLPVLLVPGDVFATRDPDPVLQQVEHFQSGDVSANDCFKPVSRYFDRITRPEQLLDALPRAMRTLTDRASCGPVTLAFPQDAQAMAYDFPVRFFAKKLWDFPRYRPDRSQLETAKSFLSRSRRPLIVAGGGVHYSEATETLRRFAETYQIPVAETQAGKGCLTWEHPLNVGAVGVTGGTAANTLAAEADAILAVGTRLQDFTTGSRSLFQSTFPKILHVNAQLFDAVKHEGLPLVADAKVALEELEEALAGWTPDAEWKRKSTRERELWLKAVERATEAKNPALPGDAEVLGVVNSDVRKEDVVVCAAGSLPGELHKLWKTPSVGGYHVEYGYSCMGYEIAGGLGVKMARPDREVIVMLGDGSYLMMNSEIASSIMFGTKLIVVVLDNRGFGCINRLQSACGGEGYNNLWKDCLQPARFAVGEASEALPNATVQKDVHPDVRFADHAKAMGAEAERVNNLAELRQALQRARACEKTYLIEIKTDPAPSTRAGGCWWEVAVPETSPNPKVQAAHADYQENKRRLRRN